MKGKAIQTTSFIIETVAPIFNKHGYSGTSMSVITQATGLSKGAIYGNFKNKEDLSFAAFKHTVDKVVDLIRQELIEITSPLAQLYALMNFYRKYRAHTIEIGGCPIVNIGVDAKHHNPELLGRVQAVITQLQLSIQKMIEAGQAENEIKIEINAAEKARFIFASIEGSIFITVTMNDDRYINEMMNHIEHVIKTEFEK